MLDALENKEHRCEFDGINTVITKNGKYCAAPATHKATLGEIVDLLEQFKNQPKTLVMPQIPNNSFAKKLYSVYLSYLPKEKIAFPLKMNTDNAAVLQSCLKRKTAVSSALIFQNPELQKVSIGIIQSGNFL